MKENNRKIEWNWKPNISVGPFKFDMSLSSAQAFCQLTREETYLPSKTPEFCYVPNDETHYKIYFKDNKYVDCIFCFSSVTYEGRDLFLLNQQLLALKFGEPDEIDSFDLSDGVGVRTLWHYDDLGLTATILENGDIESLDFHRCKN